MINLSTGQLIDSMRYCGNAKCDKTCPMWLIGIEHADTCSHMLMREGANRLEQLKAQCDRQEIEQHMLHTEPDAANDDLLEVIIYAINLCDVLIQNKRINSNTLLQFIGNTLHDREKQRLTGREEEE